MARVARTRKVKEDVKKVIDSRIKEVKVVPMLVMKKIPVRAAPTACVESDSDERCESLRGMC